MEPKSLDDQLLFYLMYEFQLTWVFSHNVVIFLLGKLSVNADESLAAQFIMQAK